MEDQQLSLSEVAGLMGVSERTVRRWIKAGRLQAFKPGRDYRIPASALRAFVRESEVSPKARGRSSLEPTLWNGVLEDERRSLTDAELNAVDALNAFSDQLEEFFVKFLPENAHTELGKNLLTMQRFTARIAAALSLPSLERASVRPVMLPAAARFVELVHQLEEHAEEVGVGRDEETDNVVNAVERFANAS